MRPTVVVPRWSPARQSTWAIFCFPKDGTENLQPLDEVADQLGELVDRLEGLDQGLGSRLVARLDDGRRARRGAARWRCRPSRRSVQAKSDRRRNGPEELLVVVREEQSDGTMKHDYHLANAAPETPLAELVRVVKAEHRISGTTSNGATRGC